jgi:hypothetical protein
MKTSTKTRKKTLLSTKKTTNTVNKTVKRYSSIASQRRTKTKTSKSSTSISNPLVYSTEGEDIIYAHLALLIDIMGGSVNETFVSYINESQGTNIVTQQVALPHRPSKPPDEYFVPGQPTVFYGLSKGTHFTCTADGTRQHLWDSYKEQVQKPHTDHFCQTFTLMRIIHELRPQSIFGKPFTLLHRGEFMDNAYIAKNYACKVIRTVYDNYEQEYVDRFIADAIQGGNPVGQPAHHQVAPNFTIKGFLKKCESFTKRDLCNSVDFKKSVYRD